MTCARICVRLAALPNFLPKRSLTLQQLSGFPHGLHAVIRDVKAIHLARETRDDAG